MPIPSLLVVKNGSKSLPASRFHSTTELIFHRGRSLQALYQRELFHFRRSKHLVVYLESNPRRSRRPSSLRIHTISFKKMVTTGALLVLTCPKVVRRR
jgi:hypothetical protein